MAGPGGGTRVGAIRETCPDLHEAFRIIDRIETKWTTPPGLDAAALLQRLEGRAGARIPPGFRIFLETFGTVRIDTKSGYEKYKLYLSGSLARARHRQRHELPPELALAQLYGIGEAPEGARSILGLLDRLEGLRDAGIDRRPFLRRPKDLVPFQALLPNVVLCLRFNDSPLTRTPVFIWDYRLGGEGVVVEVASDYCAYLRELFEECEWRIQGLAQFDVAVARFETKYGFTHREGGSLPRNYSWRPYRFCVVDEYMGILSCRHSRSTNCLEVDVFVTADVLGREHQAGARWLTLSILADAFRSGGSMEIRFLPTVQSGKVPLEIRELAEEHGIQLRHEARIDPNEARDLLLALTPLSLQFRMTLRNRQRVGLATERVCFAVLNNIWSAHELEALVLSGGAIERLLSGGAFAEERILYSEDITQGANAVLGGKLDRRLLQRSDRDVDTEDNLHDVEIGFLSAYAAKTYSARGQAIPIPWLVDDRFPSKLSPSETAAVLVRARDAEAMHAWLKADIEAAETIEGFRHILVLLPADFHELPSEERQAFLKKARRANIGLLVSRETLRSLREEAAERFARLRQLRL